MGLFNQGWGCRCDGCGDQADESIGGRSRKSMEELARRRGFVTTKYECELYWFCGDECRDEWKRSKGIPVGRPWQIGEKCQRAILTDELVLEIRELNSQGWGYTRLAKRFHIGRTTAEHICQGRTWKHLLPEGSK